MQVCTFPTNDTGLVASDLVAVTLPAGISAPAAYLTGAQANSGGDDPNLGAIIGGAVAGAAVLAVCIAALVLLVLRRRRRAAQMRAAEFDSKASGHRAPMSGYQSSHDTLSLASLGARRWS